MLPQETKLEIDPQTCMDALAIAIPHCKKQFDSQDIKSIKLVCKGLKEIADEFLLTNLWMGPCFSGFGELPPDFSILKPALLKNIRKISICLNWKKDPDTIQHYVAETKRILKITSHNLRELYIAPTPVQLGEFFEGNKTWPHLETLTLLTGTIAEMKEELFSMRQLRFLYYTCRDTNKKDRKTLLSAPFLSNLTGLEFSTNADKTRTPLYMSKLFVRTKQLQKLTLSGYLDFDYFGGIYLENLTSLTLIGHDEIHLRPLLVEPRPNLRHLIIFFDFLFNLELENFIDSAKMAFPNLETLRLGRGSGVDEHQDWSCLARIDLPNLTELQLPVGFKDIVVLLEPTAQLPSLRKLTLQANGLEFGRPQDWEDHAEQVFASHLLHQLERLDIDSSYFRLGSLAALCKYASCMKELECLRVHCYDIEGARMIADAGKNGGFPKLKGIYLRDVDPKYFENLIFTTGFQLKLTPDMEFCLKQVWPHLDYKCWYGREEKMAKYGQLDEFDEPDQIELQELNIEDTDNDDDEA